MTVSFHHIAVIGAGTMGSAIAGHIANAGHRVALLDLPHQGDDPNHHARAAVTRLRQSQPPALFDESCAARIVPGNTRDDFSGLAQCDWIVEAVVERLDVKQDLYRRLQGVIREDCVVTSNTSTIPIAILLEGMTQDFRRRFAITHYFNPVRYMRLLELVRGADTRADIIEKLAHFNDVVLGKGVVRCGDTPGFLGNRVGVYALQVGLDCAWRMNIPVAAADALMGRPMGIPKTGIFGLYDLIGLDLMADVVVMLGNILPEDDPFHMVGARHNPLHPLIEDMIAAGFTGNKGGGGFYRKDATGRRRAIDLSSGTLLRQDDSRNAMPAKAVHAMQTLARNADALPGLVRYENTGADVHTRFCRQVLARVLGYAAGLIPAVSPAPQDIDDAMKLGFNWTRGPFEMMDAIGHNEVRAMLREASVAIPPLLQAGALGDDGADRFYRVAAGAVQVAYIAPPDPPRFQPVNVPRGAMRFGFLRRTLSPIASNTAASLYVLPDDIRLVEFHSKANVLSDHSMAIIAAAAADHGRGIIIHNDGNCFSAGVDLTLFRAMIEQQEWEKIDTFLHTFQQAVCALKYCPVPVVAAPSGLALGGGFEVLLHTDCVVAHTNTVLGLVESGVGLVPSGGGVKEVFLRYGQACGDWQEAAWQSWMQIGYGRTATSPQTAIPLQYFRAGIDRAEMNRDRLLGGAIAAVEDMHKRGYAPPQPPVFSLPGAAVYARMQEFMATGVAEGRFSAHDREVALAIATILVSDTDEGQEADEAELYARERRAFLRLARTEASLARIVALLDTGVPLRN